MNPRSADYFRWLKMNTKQKKAQKKQDLGNLFSYKKSGEVEKKYREDTKV